MLTAVSTVLFAAKNSDSILRFSAGCSDEWRHVFIVCAIFVFVVDKEGSVLCVKYSTEAANINTYILNVFNRKR